MKRTAFISHYDCARHDTGWGHPDHQGRLPAVMRAVYRDMLALHGPILEAEGRHATDEELRLFHSAEYLERVREWAAEAGRRGAPYEVAPGLMASEASWAASAATAGTVIAATELVLAGEVRNAFCAVRPAGADASREAPGRFGYVNPAAVAGLALLRRPGVERVLIVDWSGAGVWSALGSERLRVVPSGLDRELDLARDEADFALLVLSFDSARGEGDGAGDIRPEEYHRATARLVEAAERACGGHLVSVLDGGYEPDFLGSASVQHLRALAGLPAAG